MPALNFSINHYKCGMTEPMLDVPISFYHIFKSFIASVLVSFLKYHNSLPTPINLLDTVCPLLYSDADYDYTSMISTFLSAFSFLTLSVTKTLVQANKVRTTPINLNKSLT